jgi:hypothetical protein
MLVAQQSEYRANHFHQVQDPQTRRTNKNISCKIPVRLAARAIHEDARN